jgi:hypothetical protein
VRLDVRGECAAHSRGVRDYRPAVARLGKRIIRRLWRERYGDIVGAPFACHCALPRDRSGTWRTEIGFANSKSFIRHEFTRARERPALRQNDSALTLLPSMTRLQESPHGRT